jgi:hypothetical protein
MLKLLDLLIKQHSKYTMETYIKLKHDFYDSNILVPNVQIYSSNCNMNMWMNTRLWFYN